MVPSEALTDRRQRPLRGLLTDPPLVDRLTWREGIQAQTLISEDRGLMARTFGTLALLGGVLGLLLTAVGNDNQRETLSLVLISVASLVLGVIAFVGYTRLPHAFFHGALLFGTGLITIAGADGAPGGEAAYAFYYVWIVFVACLFFSIGAAALHAAVAAGAFAAILLVRDNPFEINLLVSAIATFGATGAIVGILRARVEGVASALASEVNTDPMTGLINRRGFDAGFRAEVDRAAKLGRSLSLIICDLDRFKAVNDELGHEEGDLTLGRASAAIAEATRTSDLVARLGGEEFGVVLPETDAEGAFAVAERIRNSIRVEFDGFPVTVTASCGVAALEVGAAHEDLFRAADAALYVAKRDGRNRTATGRGDDTVVPLRRSAG
jgi:diguanylate cyclase (GGDEF)-like protein